MPRKHRRGREKLLLIDSTSWAGGEQELGGVGVRREGGPGSSERARQVAGCPVSPWCLLVSKSWFTAPCKPGMEEIL